MAELTPAEAAVDDALRQHWEHAPSLLNALAAAGWHLIPEHPSIEVVNRWQYSDRSECICCEGRHCFARGSALTASDWTRSGGLDNGVLDHVREALASFGDGARVRITFEEIR